MSDDILTKAHTTLSNDQDWEVNMALARNSKDPVTLKKLSTHAQDHIRFLVASNPHTPHETIETLSQDPDPHVRGGVGQNTATSPKLLGDMADKAMKHINLYFHAAVNIAANKNTPPEALHKLANHVSTQVRVPVARNPKITLNTYDLLKNDSSYVVRSLIKKHLSEAYHHALMKEKTHKKIKDEGGRYVGSGLYHKAGGDSAGFITPTGVRSDLHNDLKLHQVGGLKQVTHDAEGLINTSLENTDNPKALATLGKLRDFKNRSHEIRADQREYVREMHNHLMLNADDPDEDTMGALNHYTNDSTTINKNLHHAAAGTLQSHRSQEEQKKNDEAIELLDKFTRKGETRKPMVVYTGLTRDPTEHFATPHKIIRVPRFLSTSIDSYCARDFASTKSKGKVHESHILKINLPKGAPGQYIEPHTRVKNEKEFLLPRDCHLRFREKYRDYHNPDMHVWEVDYLHSRSPKKKLDEAKLSPSKWKDSEAETELVHANEQAFLNRQPHLNSEQSSHVYSYTSDSYALNKPLFHGKELGDKWTKVSKGLSKMINSHSVSEPTSVFTGVSFDPDEKQQALKTKRIHLPSFTSATLAPHRAERFAWVQYHRKPELKDMHVLHIDLPEGHPATYLGDHSNFPSEREVLLDKGLTLRVKSKRTYNTRESLESAKLHVWHCVPVKGKK